MGVFASGCLSVTVYQPQKAIHRPVVVMPAETNFTALKILVRCHADDDDLHPDDASKLCNGLAEDFRRQGAESESVVPSGKSYVEPEVFDGARPDLVVEIESKIDHEYEYGAMAAASILTLTLVPSVNEQTFSQRVVVFGRDNSVLNEEVFRERFIEYNGIGVWSVNYLLDWFVRDDNNQMSGDAAAKDFTRDFYGQIRQMTFNAKVRSEVLGLLAPPRRRQTVGDAAPPKRTGRAAPGPQATRPQGLQLPGLDDTDDTSADGARTPIGSSPVVTGVVDDAPQSPPEEPAPAAPEPKAQEPVVQEPVVQEPEPPTDIIEAPLTLPGELELPDSASLPPASDASKAGA